MKYKYKLADIDCQFCENKGKARCSIYRCSHIMKNLSDLFADSNFREAVRNAENCETLHKNTLIYLKNQAIERGYDLFEPNTKFRLDFRPECETCSFASHGFICHNEKDGTCMKDWIKGKHHAGS